MVWVWAEELDKVLGQVQLDTELVQKLVFQLVWVWAEELDKVLGQVQLDTELVQKLVFQLVLEWERELVHMWALLLDLLQSVRELVLV